MIITQNVEWQVPYMFLINVRLRKQKTKAATFTCDEISIINLSGNSKVLLMHHNRMRPVWSELQI